MPIPRPEPRVYRVRIFAPDTEILINRKILTVLDMTPGPGSDRAKAELDSLLKTLAALDNPAVAAPVSRYYLIVADTHTGEAFTWLPR